ncbi:hypothetical protein [uncultured Sulfitobacter sp.]|uniref:hypothetical protein n=1 Tax=uncultured Sulfitobacter sp. TaxID=191468 RepID=UPI002604C445|nr:hypothetical protein [uncultured Sulfitobacter sp.]
MDQKRGEIAGHYKVALRGADVLTADLGAIDRLPILCCYEDNSRHRPAWKVRAAIWAQWDEADNYQSAASGTFG